MKKQKLNQTISLRERAEMEIHKKRLLRSGPLSEADTLKLFPKLEPNQIEPELRNEEFQLSIDNAEIANAFNDFSPLGYFTLNPDSTICELNHNAAVLLGEEQSGLINKDFRSFITPDRVSDFNEFVRIVFEKKTKQTCELSLSNKDHAFLFVYVQGILSKNGQKCLLSTQDITERISEQQYYFLFENSLDAILLTSPDGRIIEANPSACRLFDRTVEELRHLVRGAHTDDTDPRLVEALNERRLTGKFIGELLLLRRDGTKFPAEVTTGTFADKKGIIHTSMIIRDISERKLAEKSQLELHERVKQLMTQQSIILENANVGILMIVNKKQIWVNRKMEEMFQYTKEEMVGQTSRILYPNQEEYDIMEKKVYTALKKGLLLEVEQLLMKRDGSSIMCSYIGQAVDPTDMTKGTIWIIDDITKRKLAEETLQKNEIRLKELIATKDKFFSIIAHDLRNPLNTIIGFSEILINNVKEKSYEGVEKYADYIFNSSQRILALLNNLLQWAKTQNGSIVINPESIEMGMLTRDLVELASDAARQKSISICCEVDQNTTVFADKAMMNTILRNLISNAIKYSHPGGRIMITVKKEKHKLMLSVSDNGIGMSQKILNGIFSTNANIPVPGTRKEIGSGLGLILCKEFVDKLQGKIWVESEVGKGAVFNFTIPDHENIF